MMSILRSQNELKLDILQSIARSQRALAEIVETIAPVVASSVQWTSLGYEASSDHMAQQILTNLGSLSSYQNAIARKLSGIAIRHVKYGSPGKPWLAPAPHFLRSKE
jgi:hypothetical protein